MTRTAKRAASPFLLAGVLACGVAALVSSGPASPPEARERRGSAALTFTKDVAPIVFQHCSACHRPGGSAPFSLLSYADVRKRARKIAAVTESRFMPPWLPEPGYGEFVGERRLSADQIAIIRQWVEEGAARGDPSDLPPVPKQTGGWQLGRPELVIQMPEPYTLPAKGTDVFRNFVVPIPVRAPRYVRTMELRPGNPKIVHHAVMMIDRTPSSQRLAEQDPEPGFGGMDVSSEAHVPGGHLLGWTPGKMPFGGAPGVAWRLEEGTDLVLQLHLLPSGRPEVIQSTVGFFFTDEAPTRFPFMLRLGSKTIDIPAGKKDYVIEDRYELPVDVEVLGVYPHAHYLGKDMQGFATLPDGSKQRLIHIEDWDFKWQDEYRYTKPIRLPKGTTLTMRFTYDNSADNVRNPHHPPTRVVYGPQSSDEMGDLWIQVLPLDSDDLAILTRDFGRKDLKDRIAGYRHSLRMKPQDARTQNNLGMALESRGQLERAIRHYRRAIEIEMDYAAPHHNLGDVLAAQGKLDEAIGHYRRALEIRPGLVNAHTNLGIALQRQGERDEAIRHYRHALQIEPDYTQALHNLGMALAAQGKLDEAIHHYRRVLQAKPDYAATHNNLGNALLAQDKLDQAIEHYRHALEIQPAIGNAHNNLGVALSEQGRIEDAIRHFRQELRIQPDNAEAHYNLGKALSSQGKLEEAIRHFREALRIRPGYAEARHHLQLVLSKRGPPGMD